MSVAPVALPLGRPQQEIRTIGLVGLAHATSHFHHLLLPPLFPVFIRDFGLSYSELGGLVSVFFVLSGVGQALSGFVVDRIGARPVLFFAVACFIAASLAAASAQGYAGLMAAAALAGMGNSPFHPANFTILNKRVSRARLGHAFSVHGISGNLGWALAPVFLVGLTEAAGGQWRLAYLATAALALAVLVVLVAQRHALDDRARGPLEDPGLSREGAAGSRGQALGFLKLPTVWLCFSFFFWSTAALSAVQSFGSPVLDQVYGLPGGVTAGIVTAYMLCSAAGMVAGGFLVGAQRRLERTIAQALAVSAGMFLLVASGWPSPWAAAALVALAGLGSGLAGPSRDLLIKEASPPDATGRVYGTVYSGLDVGFAVTAPVFGALMDAGRPHAVFAVAAAALAMAIASAQIVAWASRRTPTVEGTNR